MNKIAFFFIAMGMSSTAAASQAKSIQYPVISSVPIAVAVCAARDAKPLNMTPFAQTPAFQSLERAQQQLAAQGEQLRKENVQFVEEMRWQRELPR